MRISIDINTRGEDGEGPNEAELLLAREVLGLRKFPLDKAGESSTNLFVYPKTMFDGGSVSTTGLSPETVREMNGDVPMSAGFSAGGGMYYCSEKCQGSESKHTKDAHLGSV